MQKDLHAKNPTIYIRRNMNLSAFTAKSRPDWGIFHIQRCHSHHQYVYFLLLVPEWVQPLGDRQSACHRSITT